MTERVRIGELLVETGLISQDQLKQALDLQKEDRRRLGEILVARGMVSESKVTQIISQQLSIPWVSLEYIDFSRQLLNLVSSETAQKYTLVPIYVRRSKNKKETLYVAMEDPSDARALEEITEYSGLPVRPMIAPSSDIRSAIRAYYLGLPPEQPPSPMSLAPDDFSDEPDSQPPQVAVVVPSDAKDAENARQIARAEEEGMIVGQQPPASPEEEDMSGSESEESEVHESAPLSARDSEMPTPPKKNKNQPEMITLTMLDGTTMRLPASGRKKRASGSEPGELTARDLVEALRAQGKGADVSEVFGEDVNWQSMFAALLSLLLKKHLIHDWEFVRELKQ